MVNNNFKKLMSVCAPFPKQGGVSLQQTNGSFLTGVISINWGGKDRSFEKVKYTDSPSSYYLNGVTFGDSDQPATVEDYKLAGNIISNLVASVTISKSDNDITARFTITNNNSTEVTIKEVCYTAYFQYFTSSWGSNSNGVVIDRTVLDTPVTIPTGGVGQIVYTITFNYPA